MKKILAIAVATAIAAPAMADMTIGGTVVAGYASNDTTTSGWGIDTASLSVSGSEALENGLTVAGGFNVGGIQRAATITGEDAYMSISGGFGTFKMSSYEAGNGVYAFGSAGSPAEELSGELVAKGNLDAIAYTLPAFGAFTVAIGESSAADGVGAGDNNTFDPDVNVAYAEGALSAFANYKTCASDNTTCDSRVRFGAKYDAGVAVVAAAYGDENNDGDDVQQTAVGVSVPMGATTLGLNWGKSVTGSASALTAASFGVKHTLSSNVSVAAKYTNYETSATTDVTKSSVLVSLSF